MSGADIKDKKRWIDSLKASKNTENYRKKASENAKKQWLLISAEERKKKMGNLRKISKSKWLYSWSRKYEKCAECGTQNIPHYSLGRCIECHKIWYREKQQKDRNLERKTTYFEDGRFYGKKGVIEHDRLNDKVRCHLCGNWYDALGTHLWKGHKVELAWYKKEFGINRRQGLENKRLEEILRETLKRTEAINGVPLEVAFCRQNTDWVYAQMRPDSYIKREQMKIDKSNFMKSIGGWQKIAPSKVKNWQKKIIEGLKKAIKNDKCKRCGKVVIAWAGKYGNTYCLECRKEVHKQATYKWAIKNFGSWSNYQRRLKLNNKC